MIYGNGEEGATEILNKLGTEQKILELFETKEIEKIEITYKKANNGVKLFENEKASATDSSLTTVTVNYVVNVDEAKVSEVYYTC